MKTSIETRWQYVDSANHPITRCLPSGLLLTQTDIKILTPKSAEELWLSLFGCVLRRRDFSHDHWLNGTQWEHVTLNWLPAYNSDQPEGVTARLRDTFPHPMDARVYLFREPAEAIETSWGTFTSLWPTFFEYDDESYVWVGGTNDLLVVTPHGDMKRTSIQ